jgi:hypothetical protein
MPEREFELYLSLLTRLLRLDAAQREQIADELRDHFDERFEELLAAGQTREEAIRATLDEFGDAAGLAAHFSHIGNRRRRTIMRCTLGTAAGLIAAGVVAVSFWTEVPPVAPGPAVAIAQQAPPKGAGQPASETTKPAGASAVEAKLDQRRLQLDFVETPLKDVLEFLSDAHEVDILLNKRVTEELGVAEETPITLQVKRTMVTARTALELVLEQVSSELGYTVRDGLVYVTKKYDSDEIQVYNVRDLLESFPSTTVGQPVVGPLVAGGLGHGGLGGEGGMGPTSASPAGQALAAVIESTVLPDTWSSVGGSGSLAEFNGLLIVKQSQTVHREIKQLLETMRDVAKRNPAAR